MASKPTRQPESSEPTATSGTDVSGVSLTRGALHKQRVAQIEADLNSGACTTDEAIERMIQSTLMLYRHWLSTQELTAIETMLREQCATHEGFRSVLERKDVPRQ